MAKPSKGLPLTPLSPDNTPIGRLPPFEVAKAYAFDVVIGQMEKHLGKSASLFLGQERGEFISNQLKLKGGGKPTRQAVYQNIRRCKEKGWYPGKVLGDRMGRTPDITQHQKQAIANALMAAKRRLEKPTPELARAMLPRLSINPNTGNAISDTTIYNIMHTM